MRKKCVQGGQEADRTIDLPQMCIFETAGKYDFNIWEEFCAIMWPLPGNARTVNDYSGRANHTQVYGCVRAQLYSSTLHTFVYANGQARVHKTFAAYCTYRQMLCLSQQFKGALFKVTLKCYQKNVPKFSKLNVHFAE